MAFLLDISSKNQLHLFLRNNFPAFLFRYSQVSSQTLTQSIIYFLPSFFKTPSQSSWGACILDSLNSPPLLSQSFFYSQYLLPTHTQLQIKTNVLWNNCISGPDPFLYYLWVLPTVPLIFLLFILYFFFPLVVLLGSPNLQEGGGVLPLRVPPSACCISDAEAVWKLYILHRQSGLCR